MACMEIVDGGEAAKVRAGALFLALLQAKSKSKFREAATAQRELDDLGITVRFRKVRRNHV